MHVLRRPHAKDVAELTAQAHMVRSGAPGEVAQRPRVRGVSADQCCRLSGRRRWVLAASEREKLVRPRGERDAWVRTIDAGERAREFPRGRVTRAWRWRLPEMDRLNDGRADIEQHDGERGFVQFVWRDVELRECAADPRRDVADFRNGDVVRERA